MATKELVRRQWRIGTQLRLLNGDETPASFIESFRQCLAILVDWSYGPELGPDLFCLEEA